jgi:hypothetical protein
MKKQVAVVKKVRLKDRRRRESYIVYALYAVGVLLVLGALAYITRLPQLSVGTVRVEGAVLVSETAVQAEVEKVLAGSYALLVPKRMSYVVPEGTVVARVIDAFPPVQSVSVRVVDRTSLVVTVVERTAFALWCQPAQAGADKCYKMDEYGYVFDRGERVASLRLYRGLLEAPLGLNFLDGGFHDFESLMARLESAVGTTITEVSVDSTGDVRAALLTGGELRFTRAQDEGELLADVRSVFGSKALTSGRALDYVDLRFPGKAVAKFKGE